MKKNQLKSILTREFLESEYSNGSKSIKQIATEVGCDRTSVENYLCLFRIPLKYNYFGRKNQKHPQWRGYGDISMTYWRNVKHGARTRHIAFKIKIKDAWELYLKQNRKCALTGRSIGFEASKSNSASLDRIDASKPYVLGNLQWVHRDINFAKQSLSNETFVKLCREVSHYAHPETVIIHDRQKFYCKPIYWYEFSDCKNIPRGFLNVPSTPYYEFGGPHQKAMEKLEIDGFNIVEGAEI